MLDNASKRELEKSASKTKELKTEIYLLSKRQGAIILVFALLLFAGMFLNLLTKNLIVNFVGLILMLSMAFAVVIMYAIVRKNGPINYEEFYFFDKNGAPVVLQKLNKVHFIVSFNGAVLECKKGEFATRDTLFRPQNRWDWYLNASFNSCTPTTKDAKRYDGVAEDKKATLLIKNGRPEYAEALGCRIKYFTPNAGFPAGIELPSALIKALTRLGANLPAYITPVKK